MQRNVDKVFKELAKKGMTRGFIQIGTKSYIYPPMVTPKKMSVLGYVIMAIILIALAGVFYKTVLQKERQPKAPTANLLPAVDGYGLTALHHAVIAGDLPKAADLIKSGADINCRDDYGWTPLHWAAFSGKDELYRVLLEKGANIAIKTSRRWFKYEAGLTAAQILAAAPRP